MTPSPVGGGAGPGSCPSALATAYDVSYCNLAVSGATSTDVLRGQLADAVAHRPDLASLVVGVNDTMRAGWHAGRVREELMTCASALHDAGATLLTARFHDHGAVFGLPGVLRRPLHARIEAVNAVYDEVHGDVSAATGSTWRRGSTSSTAPSGRWTGCTPPSSDTGRWPAGTPTCSSRRGWTSSRRRSSRRAASSSGGGRTWPGWSARAPRGWAAAARDLGPWAVRMAWEETRPRRTPVSG